MILVLDNEVRPDYRYLAPEITRLLPDAKRHVFVDDPTVQSLKGVDGVVLGGSTASVYDSEHEAWVDAQCDLVHRCLEESIPILGICFGHQLANVALGGTVEADERRATFVECTHDDCGVLEGVFPPVPALHADRVTELGTGLSAVGKTTYDEHFCTVHDEKPLWTVQFHPEFTERVRDNPSDWDDGAFTFADSNAPRVLDNFAEYCGY
ncbi:type 1 glutamine amidotransferase [Natrialbaceae archaeon A-chndr2]|uniref:type 1 glutamine amidotransferase n=1 Tax=Natronosalvus amylolyticus TaxID=2961994 RepID=UPI0020C9A890|nr:gamma-glutamyl-gamma-aminobutyrate hydrolase family protein [Natronosalvus amylolyticus]